MWSDFEARKEALFNDQLINTYLSLEAFVKNFPETISIQSKLERGILKGVFKKTIELKNDIAKLDKNFYFQLHQSAVNLSEIMEAVEYELWSRRSPDEGPKKRGPKRYPKVLRKWVFETIDPLKGNTEKLLLLVHFFSPEGEFDTWLRKKSKNLHKGPQKDYDTSYSDEKSDIEAKIKWLNGFKNQQNE
ncbi:MAG: hypothetical protein WA160_06535 [Pseudobdellovibrio sp.]